MKCPFLQRWSSDDGVEQLFRKLGHSLLEPWLLTLVLSTTHLPPWMLELLGQVEVAAKKTHVSSSNSDLHCALCIAPRKLMPSGERRASQRFTYTVFCFYQGSCQTGNFAEIRSFSEMRSPILLILLCVSLLNVYLQHQVSSLVIFSWLSSSQFP